MNPSAVRQIALACPLQLTIVIRPIIYGYAFLLFSARINVILLVSN